MSIKTMPVPQTLMVTPIQTNPDVDHGVLLTQVDHLSCLKALAEKLNLETVKPSHVEWRFQLESQRPKALETLVAVKGKRIRPWSSQKWSNSLLDIPVNKTQWHSCKRLKGFESITEALGWLKEELGEMSAQDQQLALQLVRLHGDLNKLKIEQVCRQHRKMLNDATFELEERYEMLDLLCDVPVTTGSSISAPLKLIGITKMNISFRRFSLC